MTNKMTKFKIINLSIITCILLYSCKNDRRYSDSELLDDVSDSLKVDKDDNNQLNKKPNRIAKAIFYLENSASMFGYVNGFTDYVDVVSDLSEKPQFVTDSTNREFWFVNGGEEIKLNKIGDDPILLKDKLNPTGFNVGNIKKSNLNAMLQIALQKAKNDTISILISDGLYDIGKAEAPLNALLTKGRETRSRFIERLNEGDLQTIILKMKSQFKGNYYPVTGGINELSQNRPYYIWIFGHTDLLNKYFSDEYYKSLKNFQDAARFLKVEQIKVPFEITSQNTIGTFRTDMSSKNTLSEVKKDRNSNQFQFAIAVDFSDTPLSESYLMSHNNYNRSNKDYDIISIERAEDKKLFNLNISPTHIITLRTNKSPYGNLTLSLLNNLPNWIDETNINNETNIIGDENHTFGFKFLTDGIHGAYDHINQKENIATFKVQLKK